MNILGIFAEGPNPASCILIDGKLIAFGEEERFIRIKTASGYWPFESIRYCLNCAGLSIDEIDVIAFGWNALKYENDLHGSKSYMECFYNKLNEKYTKDSITLESEKRILNKFKPVNISNNINNILLENGSKKVGSIPIMFVDHHLAHAASAFYSSGFDKSAIITLDGSGEEICLAFWIGQGNKLIRDNTITIPNSLGWFYSSFVEYLGFKPYRDEGKFMALASFGHPDPHIEAVVNNVCKLDLSLNSFSINPYYIFYGKHSWGHRFTDKLVEELGEPSHVGESPNARDANIAYSVQSKLETIIQHLIKCWLPKTGMRKLCLAGGVTLNCKMNGSLTACINEGIFDDLFIQPISSDAGTALGAAMVASLHQNFDPRFEMKNTFWGPEYSESEIRNELQKRNIPYQFCDTPKLAAKLLFEGAVIGWFQGRAEMGPRSLGNRSILANPMNVNSPDDVNRKVKHREKWRPFAPSILQEATPTYFQDTFYAPFMIRSVKVKPAMIDRIPAVVHIDGSTRPQTVGRFDNSTLRSLLLEFQLLTGEPIILNTSFNGPGEPIVCSPSDAINRYLESDLDALVMGNILSIKKKL
jgi:carbamoyltransferase